MYRHIYNMQLLFIKIACPVSLVIFATMQPVHSFTTTQHAVSSLFRSNTWYIPGPVPEPSTLATLKLLSKENGNEGKTIKLKFELNGKHNCLLHSPPCAPLVDVWNISQELQLAKIPISSNIVHFGFGFHYRYHYQSGACNLHD